MTAPAPARLRDLRLLAGAAAGAEDAALLRVVQLLDSLPERGETDRVLDPVRPRLGALRPSRPLRFARLLFLPLDGAILPPAAWRRGGHQVPRSAISPISAAVAAALGPLGAEIEAALAGRTTGDATLIVELGARLWPAAAAALPEKAPPGWAEAGLVAEDYAPIRALIEPLLHAGPLIHAAQRSAAEGPPAHKVRQALAGPAEAGPLPLAAAVAVLLHRAAAPGAVLMVAADFGAAGRAAASRMAEVAIAGLPDPAAAPLGDAAMAAGRFFFAAADLARSGLLDPERQRRLTALQHAAETECRRRVAEAGTSQVVQVLATLAGAASVDEASLARVEADARALRAVAQVGRGVGDPAAYDRTLRGLADAIGRLRTADAPSAEALTPVDLARVVEILAGPDAATALLAARSA